MNKETNKNHFTPIFANKYWTSEQQKWVFSHYYYCNNRKKFVKASRAKGYTAWGYENNIYSQKLEDRLDKELENDAALLYQKLIDEVPLTADERMKWGQFIITQAVRTPSFFKYRDKVSDHDYSYKETIIGCPGCEENKYIACRNWVILDAAEGDFFVRTDNPVYITGFIENALTTVFYPLTPRKCFVACSMMETIPVLKGEAPPFPKQESLQLEKGDVHHINFELMKSASSSLIVAPLDDSDLTESMALEVMGSFPQIPFLMSNSTDDYESFELQERLIEIMGVVDGISYPNREYPFRPFFGVEFSVGINPFSVFGVTDDRLPDL